MELEIEDVSLDVVLTRDIVRNVICSDEYIRAFATIPNWQGLLPVPWADSIISAALAFFKKFKTAPSKKYILDFLDKNQKEFVLADQDLGDIIDFIDGLELGEIFNAAYEIDNAITFLKRKSLEKTKSSLSSALDSGDVSRAEQALRSAPPVDDVGAEEFSVLDMDDLLMAASMVNDEPLVVMGGAFGSLVSPHIKRGGLVFFLATAKVGKTWSLFTLASVAYNSGKNVLLLTAGDMDKLDSANRIGHIMSVGDIASEEQYSGDFAYPVLDSKEHQRGECPYCTNNIALPKTVEELMTEYASPEDMLRDMPLGYTPCTAVRKHADLTPTWYYETRSVKYKGWTGLNRHKEISKRRNGKNKFIIRAYPTDTLTCSEIERILEVYKAKSFIPDIVLIDYADIMGLEAGVKASEERHKENARWKQLRKLSQTGDRPCIVTVTQANRSAYGQTSVGAVHVNEDRRKLDHATAVFGISQTDDEKAYRITRVHCIMARKKAAPPNREVVLLQGFESGKFVRNSFWRRKKD